MGATHQFEKVYYLYGYGKAVDFMIPQQSTLGGTIAVVPPLGEILLTYLSIVNANTEAVTVVINDGSIPIYSATIPAGGTLTLQDPVKLIFLRSITINTGGKQVFVYGAGKVFLPPSF